MTPQQEADLAAAFQRAYDAWLPQVEAAVLGNYNRFGSPPNPAAINTTATAWREQVQQVEDDELQPMAEESYNAEIAGIAGAAAFVLLGFIIGDAVISSNAFLLAQVGEVQAQLMGITRGKSAKEAAAAISEYLNPANPHWAGKAAQFAATEGDRWTQAATLAGGWAAQRADGIAREKIWVSRDDALVRPAHVAADGQRQPLMKPFIVGGFPMMYPLDPAAPAGLVVNCRCRLRIVRAEVNRVR